MVGEMSFGGGWRRLAIALSAAGIAISPGLAQEVTTAKSGEEVRLGWFGSIQPNCTVGKAPDVRASQVAGHGVIRISEGNVRTDSVENCPGLEVPAKVIYYKSSPGFTGSDAFTIEITSESGKVTSRTFTLAVE